MSSPMKATIPSASDRPPIDWQKGLTKTEPSAPPKVYTAKEAAGQLAEHMSKQYPPGEVPDSILLAKARAAGPPQPVHEDPFNPTPEDYSGDVRSPMVYEANQIMQSAAPPKPQQPVQQVVAQQQIPQVAVPLNVAQAQAELEAAQARVLAVQAQAQQPVMQQQITPITHNPQPQQPAVQETQVSSEVQEFLDAKIRVTLTLQDGTFAMPATAIRETQLAVFVFFPDTPSSVTFVPKPGTALQISVDRGGEYKSWDVYYPGTYVSIGELAQTVVAFIKAEE